VAWFNALFPRALFTTLAVETNRYARAKDHLERIHQTETTVAEMLGFTGCLLLMGIVRMTALADYFRPASTRLPAVDDIFAFNRFRWLVPHFHLVDNDALPACPAVERKVWPVLSALRQSFRNSLVPGSHLTIDEFIVPFKGRDVAVQFYPNKPIRFGYKHWQEVMDSGSLYFVALDVFGGKGVAADAELADDADDGSTDTDRLVHRLLDMVRPTGDSTRVFVTDNFFVSVGLLDCLRQKGILAYGTVRRNRLFIDKQTWKSKAEALEYGQSAFAQRDPGLVLALWKEKKLVCTLSTCHPAGQTTTLQRFDRATAERQSVQAPQVVKDYNQQMGFVDRVNAAINIRTLLLRSKRNWFKLWQRLLLMACWNAFHLFRLEQPQSTMEWKEFLVDLAHDLISDGSAAQAEASAAASHAMSFGHDRRHCTSCGQRTTWKCQRCGATCTDEPMVHSPRSVARKRARSSSP
jgi:hypothetical protein